MHRSFSGAVLCYRRNVGRALHKNNGAGSRHSDSCQYFGCVRSVGSGSRCYGGRNTQMFGEDGFFPWNMHVSLQTAWVGLQQPQYGRCWPIWDRFWNCRLNDVAHKIKYMHDDKVPPVYYDKLYYYCSAWTNEIQVRNYLHLVVSMWVLGLSKKLDLSYNCDVVNLLLKHIDNLSKHIYLNFYAPLNFWRLSFVANRNNGIWSCYKDAEMCISMGPGCQFTFESNIQCKSRLKHRRVINWYFLVLKICRKRSYFMVHSDDSAFESEEDMDEYNERAENFGW